jgi:uncharacterized protein YmfQ (DUF2313 family)
MPIVELIGADDSSETEDTTLDVVSLDYLRVLQDLLPPGPAWNRRPGSWLTRLLQGLSYEPARIERDAQRLIEEADPSTTQELLEDWERFAGLPETCGQAPTTVEGRQQALVAKLTQNLSPRPATFITIAEDLGYTGVSVRREGDPFTCISNCNDTLRGAAWIFTWTLVVAEHSANDDTLRCMVQRLAPIHSHVLFEYTEDL